MKRGSLSILMKLRLHLSTCCHCCVHACVPRRARMRVHVQIMALPVCGLYHSSITCLRWLIDCHDYAPFSCYNTKHGIRIACLAVTRSFYTLNVLSTKFTLSLIPTRRRRIVLDRGGTARKPGKFTFSLISTRREMWKSKLNAKDKGLRFYIFPKI